MYEVKKSIEKILDISPLISYKDRVLLSHGAQGDREGVDVEEVDRTH